MVQDPKPRTFRVAWEVDVVANDAHDAAMLARATQKRGGPLSGLFEVSAEPTIVALAGEVSSDSGCLDRLTMLQPRELGSVLAGLRLLQRALSQKDGLGDDLLDITTNGGTLPPLDASEIDALCESLNSSGCGPRKGSEAETADPGALGGTGVDVAGMPKRCPMCGSVDILLFMVEWDTRSQEDPANTAVLSEHHCRQCFTAFWT